MIGNLDPTTGIPPRQTFAAAWAKWQQLQPLTLPPAEDILLWQGPNRTIYLDSEWGAAVPYPAIPRETVLDSNHGFVRVKGNPALIEGIPEVQGWPEYAEFLRKLNEADSPVESIGCAVDLSDHDHHQVKYRIGSYVDVIFSDVQRLQDPESNIRVAAMVMDSIDGCEAWWSGAEIGLQRMRLAKYPDALGLMIRLSAHGRSKEEARLFFRESLQRVEAVIPSLDSIG